MSFFKEDGEACFLKLILVFFSSSYFVFNTKDLVVSFDSFAQK